MTGAKLRQRLDRLEGLAESLAGHHLSVDNVVLSKYESTANPFVASKLQIDEGAPIVFIERRRSVGGLPLSLDTTALRSEAIPLLANRILDVDDIFGTLERELGVRLGWAENTFEAVAADKGSADHLGVRIGSPLLLLHRLTYLETGVPFDLESVRYRGDRLSLVMTSNRVGSGRPPAAE
ncbi:GntR family transcriptional regulator [Tsukamurella soli]|uniref:GntR family transcriptional regulator n=1 Tax=Tsukamurella soli TaxID=644556 RepID=UPI0031E725A2